MTEGSILLASLRQSDGSVKIRPVLFLRRMPPFQDLLVCGLSSQLHQAAPSFDEIIQASDPDFATSGLKVASVVRLGFLAVLPQSQFKGRIGSISVARHASLLTKLSEYLRP